MGSMITLGIGKLEIDWGKNNFFTNHSKLFLPSEDVCEIPYYYADNVVEYKEGLSRPLKGIKRRLELLGYPLHSLRSLYDAHLSSVPDYYPDVPVTFDEFYQVISSLDVNNIDINENDHDYDLGEFLSRYLFRDPEFNRVTNLKEIVNRDIGTTFENMDPYLTLRILMENPKNLDLNVYWAFSDAVEGGWVEREGLFSPLDDSDKILIVTEGSSDAFILDQALEILAKDISDFFYFVDMEEHYPFTGTGNLYRFCQGLVSIRIQNKVLVVYDNDVAGVHKYSLSKKLPLPKNMHVARLPDYQGFRNFETLGPNGRSREDINGAAVAIECFLDHSYKTKTTPCVRWTSYDSITQTYQGELIDKDSYVKRFKQARSKDGGYDFGKLRYLIDHLYNEWVQNSS